MKGPQSVLTPEIPSAEMGFAEQPICTDRRSQVQLHSNANLTLKTHILLVPRVRRQGWPVAKPAHAAGVNRKAANKWLNLFRESGEDDQIVGRVGLASDAARLDRPASHHPVD